MQKKEFYYGEETVLLQKKVPKSKIKECRQILNDYLLPLRAKYHISYNDGSEVINLPFTSKIEARKAQFELAKKGFFVKSGLF